MSERRSAEEREATTFIRALVNAWDCCATCAGGVLAKRERIFAAHLADVEARLAAVEALADEYEAQAVPPESPVDYALMGVASRLRAALDPSETPN